MSGVTALTLCPRGPVLPGDTDEQMLGDLRARPNEMQARHVESSSTSEVLPTCPPLYAALVGATDALARTRGTSRDPNDVVPPDHAARAIGNVVPSVLPEKTQP